MDFDQCTKKKENVDIRFKVVCVDKMLFDVIVTYEGVTTIIKSQNRERCNKILRRMNVVLPEL